MASTAFASTTSSGSASSGAKPARKRSKSLTITELVPPGEVLLEEFLKPMGVSQYRLALAIGVPESRINAIVKGRRTITADTDLRLCRFFGLSEGFWLRMQASHDLKLARHQIADALAGIEPLQQA
jgi:addiction module HigA family antidote